MDKLEIAKERLKGSITRLENSVEEKFFKLKSENDRLKLENASLKKQLVALEESHQSIKHRASKKEQTGFNLTSSDELAISLDELKKLAS